MPRPSLHDDDFDSSEEDWDRELPEPDDEDNGIDTIECSQCHANVDEDLPYCPVCGAEMQAPSGGLKRISMIFVIVLLVAMLLLGSLLWGL